MRKVVVYRSTVIDASNSWQINGSNTFLNPAYSRVGVGVTNPSAELEISGNLAVSGTLFGNSSIYSYDRWSAVGSTISYFENDGRVGVKNTNPQENLDVTGTTRATSDISSNGSRLIVTGNVDVSNTVITGTASVSSSTAINKWNNYGNVNILQETIPTNLLQSRELPFDLSFNSDINVIKYNRNYTKLYVGGTFTQVSVTNRNNPELFVTYNRNYFCEIDISSGLVSINTDTGASGVETILVDPSNNIYVGGTFTTVGSTNLTVNRIARWNPDTLSWSTLSTGLNGTCLCLAADTSGILYAGGAFTTAGGTTVNYISRWNGSTWSVLGTTGVSATCRGIAVDSNNIMYATGDFGSAGGVANTARVARWTGTAWQAMGTGGLTGAGLIGRAIAVDSSNNVFVGGDFTTAGGVSASYIARWNGSAWSALGTGLSTSCYSITCDTSNNVYIAGDFGSAGGSTVNQVAKWNGSSWSAFNAGVPTSFIVYTIALDSLNNIVVGGNFTNVDGGSVNTGRYAFFDVSNSEWSRRFMSTYKYDKYTGNLTNEGNAVVNTSVVVGKTLANAYSSHVLNASGRLFTNGYINSLNNPYRPVTVFDIRTTDNGFFSSFTDGGFLYINNNRQAVANSIGTREGINGGNSLTHTVLDTSNNPVAKIVGSVVNTYILTTNGFIYAMGNNAQCQCGIYNFTTDPVALPRRAFTTDSSGRDISNLVFTKLVTGDEWDPITYYALASNGNLYSVGHNRLGQLADGTTTATSSKTNKGPSRVLFNDATLTGGVNRELDGIVVDVKSAGSIWTDDNVTFYHDASVTVLDCSGNVWCAGRGQEGQCATGAATASVTSFRRALISAGNPLTGIASIYSGGHNWAGRFFALATNGDLYGWGATSSAFRFTGGTGASSVLWATKINSLLGNEAVTRVWDIPHYDYGGMFVETASKTIWGTGFGHSLGIGTSSNTGWKQITHFNATTKFLVELFPSASHDFTDANAFAITKNIYTNEYTLWATGYNGQGNLGIGTTTTIRTWVRVNMHSSMVKNIRRINQTLESNTGTVILLKSGHLLYTGRRIPIYNDTTQITQFQVLIQGIPNETDPN
jgi:alpha-tubulin suppressor-like RCC1 family protein